MQPLKERFAHVPRKPADHGPTLDYYTNAEAWKPSNETTLGDLIDAIRNATFAEKVQQVRELLASGMKAEADTLKKTLPAVSLSGCISGRRKAAVAEGRFQHSGLLQIDLDAKDNIGWSLEEMREILQTDARMVAVFITPSGQGIKGVARIPPDPATHKAAFLAAEAHFKTLNLKIDPSCKDPVRLCFVSHDPEAWLRMDTDAMFEPVVLEVVEEFEEDEEEDFREKSIPHATPTKSHHINESGGIVIRGPQFRDLDSTTVAEMLRVIPPRPEYSEWLKIASAVWDALGEVEGTAALCGWSPEEKEGEYAAKFQKRLTDVHAATLVMRAKEHGWAPTVVSSVAPRQPVSEVTGKKPAKDDDKGDRIPPHVFPVPAGDIGYDLAARHIFSVIGPTKRLFIRGTSVHEVETDDSGNRELRTVQAKRMISVIETFGAKVMRREMREDGNPRWRAATFPAQSADAIMESDAAREMLPAIRQLVSAPVIAPDGKGGSVTLEPGHHVHAGGTFITGGKLPPIVPLDEAREMLLVALDDFDFPEGGDASRALASLISPALKMGGWIDDDFPLDLAEADQSQSGKSYRFRLIHAIYREAPSAIAQAVGGVGSLDERVSRALMKGRPFITFDNFRGRLDSQILETAIRGLGRVDARSLREAADIDCTPFVWQLSTNGAELTRDIANRSVITRIRKRAADHEWRHYPEGDLIAHVKKNQARYLGAVHAVIREWAAQGCQRTRENRHDFRTWCQVLDWIVQNIFESPPLLDGHREEQMRTANPKLQWLRDVIHALVTDGHQGQPLTASDLAEAAEEHDLTMPGRRDSVEAAEVRVGKLLGRMFKEANAEEITVDGRRFTRQIDGKYDPVRQQYRDQKTYVIDADTTVQTDETDPELFDHRDP
jgi:hypothetical protein